jgi:hypothetical protein
MDLEAVASGEAPIVAPDADEHSAACPDCGRRLRAFQTLDAWLADLVEPPVPDELAAGIERLRGFSAGERRSLRLWKAPALLFGALVTGSCALLSIPIFGSSEQAGLVASIPTAIGLEWKSLALWPLSLGRGLSPAVSALSDLLLRDRGFAAISILLLLPAGFAVSRLWARHAIRK